MFLHRGYLDELWVTSKLIRQAVKRSRAFRSLATKPVVFTSGSPALVEFPIQVDHSESIIHRVRSKMARMFPMHTNRPWLHIFGSYNDNGSGEYGASLEVAAVAVKKWPRINSSTPIVTFSPHPGGFPTSYEKNIFAKYGVPLVTFEDAEGVPAGVHSSVELYIVALQHDRFAIFDGRNAARIFHHTKGTIMGQYCQ